MSTKTDIVKAQKLLASGSFTCVCVKGEHVLTSTERGVKPLLNWLDSHESYKEYSVADKVVGKAAAFLYVLLGVRIVYASVISMPALEILKKYGIDVSFEQSVEMIRNRTNTGYCPMEQATLNIDEPEEALIKIKDTIKKLQLRTSG